MLVDTRRLRRSVLLVLAATTAAAGPVFLSPASAAGGSFAAQYAGTFKITSCSPTAPCNVVLTGRGGAAYLGPSTEVGNLTVTIKIPCAPAAGTMRLTSAITSTNSISATVSGAFCLQKPITAGLKVYLKYTFTGGTGVYAHATGTGAITGTAMLKAGTYGDSWKGTINY